jgi:hypothetical protein
MDVIQLENIFYLLMTLKGKLELDQIFLKDKPKVPTYNVCNILLNKMNCLKIDISLILKNYNKKQN